MHNPLTTEEYRQLWQAKRYLEQESLIILIINKCMKVMSSGIKAVPVPQRISKKITSFTLQQIESALLKAIKTLRKEKSIFDSNNFHKAGVTVTGVVGGFIGAPATIPELILTTILFQRNIAVIARKQGEDLGDPEVQLACVEVFALGNSGPTGNTDEIGGYFQVRYRMARVVKEAVQYIAKNGLKNEAAPQLVRFLTVVASRFSIVLSEKMIADLLPVVSTLSAAMINNVFLTHFQHVATGHFTVRRLQRKYGEEVVKDIYLSIPLVSDKFEEWK